MRIRTAVANDFDGILSVLFDEGDFGFQEREAIEVSRARIERQLRVCVASETHSVLVAEDDSGAVTGYVSVAWVTCFFLRGEEADVKELFVRRDARGGGVGSALLESVERMARERGCARMSLLNMRAKESYRRRYYARRGWRERTEAAPYVRVLG